MQIRNLMTTIRQDDAGNVTLFSMFMILIVLLLTGSAVDIMRYEAMRTKLQHTIDRAVLAAADLDQKGIPKEVVENYMAAAGLENALANVVVSEGLNYRTVTATGSIPYDTMFMRLAGLHELDAPGISSAEEKVNKVEISLVLDISGSMKYNAAADEDGTVVTKIAAMRTAAKSFVDTVIRPETDGLISLNIVPYSQQVNAGPDILDEFNVTEFFDYYGNPLSHNLSHCVEFTNSDYQSVGISTTQALQQTQHFEWNQSGDFSQTVCPRFTDERIRAFSKSKTALKNQIDALQPRAGTAIYAGMKWGAAMLDPLFRPVVTNLITKSAADGAFAGRPAEYSDVETLKTVVLMTDGENSSSMKIKNHYYNSQSEINRWATENLQDYADDQGNSAYSYTTFHMNQTLGNSLLQDACDAAKLKGIVIWTIGFEVNDNGANVMRNCASSESHFFRVDGVEIEEAFHAIARQINNLRLVQ